jgi:hypothetical protein
MSDTMFGFDYEKTLLALAELLDDDVTVCQPGPNPDSGTISTGVLCSAPTLSAMTTRPATPTGDADARQRRRDAPAL